MIASTHRFHGNAALPSLFKKGGVVRGGLFNVRYVQTARGYYRASVIVSKKVHKSAVVRNRIRRRVYEYIRKNTNPSSSIDFAVIIYSEKMADAPAIDIEKSLSHALSKAGIIR